MARPGGYTIGDLQAMRGGMRRPGGDGFDWERNQINGTNAEDIAIMRGVRLCSTPPDSVVRNPEDDVLDAIDELVQDSLDHGPTDDYDRDWLVRCDHCPGEWHGLASEFNGCPGAFASDDEVMAWKAARDATPGYTTSYEPRAVMAMHEHVLAPGSDVTAFVQTLLDRMTAAISNVVDTTILQGAFDFSGYWLPGSNETADVLEVSPGFEPTGCFGTDPDAPWLIPGQDLTITARTWLPGDDDTLVSIDGFPDDDIPIDTDPDALA